MEKQTNPIARARAERGLSQEDLAKQIGVEAMTVLRWEHGLRLPQRRYWAKLQECTGVPIVEILNAAAPQTEAVD